MSDLYDIGQFILIEGNDFIHDERLPSLDLHESIELLTSNGCYVDLRGATRLEEAGSLSEIISKVNALNLQTMSITTDGLKT